MEHQMHQNNRDDERNTAVALSTASMQDWGQRKCAHAACHTRIHAHKYNRSIIMDQPKTTISYRNVEPNERVAHHDKSQHQPAELSSDRLIGPQSAFVSESVGPWVVAFVCDTDGAGPAAVDAHDAYDTARASEVEGAD